MDEVIELYESGTRVADIVLKTGISKYKVNKAIKEHQIKKLDTNKEEYVDFDRPRDSIPEDILQRIEAISITQEKLLKKMRKLKKPNKVPAEISDNIESITIQPRESTKPAYKLRF